MGFLHHRFLRLWHCSTAGACLNAPRATALERTGLPSAPSTAAACLNTPRAKPLERTGPPPARSTAAGRRGAFTAACRGA